MEEGSKIYVAGHLGLVGSAIVRNLKAQGYENLILRNKEELDLLDQRQTLDFFQKEKPDYVIDAAAKVGGILANNNYPAQFIYENIQIQSNIIHSAYLAGVKKLLFLGSSCIYPRECPQPMKEEYLLTGPLESTNEPYAIAKISGIKMCQSYNRQYGTNFIAVMPTNLYGQNDNFDLQSSHVLPAVIRKFHEVKIKKSPYVEAWGTGNPLREFLYVDDMADGCIFLMNNFNPTKEQNEKGEVFVNLGTGKEVSIKELYELGKKITGFSGEIKWDNSKPDGTPRKLLDVSKMNEMGWKYRTELEEGMAQSYKWFLENYN
ncbi:MAG TPA: GDP-L-fucose synthase [Candidatus Pacearchaeota archaeon]|nr:GDP-L-fucose synthase [Candidatus Pacearchaeota archaeon]